MLCICPRMRDPMLLAAFSYRTGSDVPAGCFFIVAELTGLEPATSSVTGKRSNHPPGRIQLHRNNGGADGTRTRDLFRDREAL